MILGFNFPDLTFVLDGVVLHFRLIGVEMMLVCVCVLCIYLLLSARCMALWSFYPRQIPGNVGNFSQTLLVTVPRQLPLTNTHTHTQLLHNPPTHP